MSAKTISHRIPYFLTASALLLVATATAGRAQNAPRAQATRTELEAALVELEKYAASSGYSSRLRNEKAREATMIKTRLRDGDLQVGDQIDIQVIGQAVFSDSFMVSSGRVLTLPGLPDIPLKGVLRSEAREYITAQLSKYIKDPQVRVSTKIRLSVLGSVGKPGFYQIPADILATDAIMVAGGPAADVDMGRVFVRRGATDIWPSDVLQEAMRRGLTLDQLNLQAGDELVVDPRKRPGGFSVATVMAVFGGLASSVYFFSRVF